MAPSNIQHRRTHNLLLINKLLNQRDATSPFTLVLDNLEQSGRDLVAEYLRRAKAAKVKTVFVSLETLRQPPDVDVFVPAWESQNASAWQRDVASHTQTAMKATAGNEQRTLLVIDSINAISSSVVPLPTLLTSLMSPTASLLAVYHLDVPSATLGPYQPSPLTTLRFLATTLLTPHSLHHVLARKAARERSLPQPVFGLEEGVEGLIIAGSGGANRGTSNGVVLEMEHRRRSGRGVKEWFYLSFDSSSLDQRPSARASTGSPRGSAILLEDHPLYRVKSEQEKGDGEAITSTFELGLSEKQRKDREGVVLPYYDAQKADGGGPGDGGRILYDMGTEDDFDEEEDEI